MNIYQRILVLDNEVEAGLIRSVLEEKGIPFNIHSLHDLAYDGLFQAQRGWGYLEAPEEYREEITALYNELINKTDK